MKKDNRADIKATVEKMASLARLRFPTEELDRFTEKAAAVIDYVEKLDELDTEGIEPTSHAVEVEQFLRDDEVKRYPRSKEILDQAPASDGPYIQVPKVIDGE